MSSSDVARSGQDLLLLLSYAPPGRPSRPIGVLLFDSRTKILHFRLPDQWDFIDDEVDREYLSVLTSDLAAKAEEMGGAALLSHLEDTLSNVLLLSALPPARTVGNDLDQSLRVAYDRFVAHTGQ
jgi:hypothetical protein